MLVSCACQIQIEIAARSRLTKPKTDAEVRAEVEAEVEVEAATEVEAEVGAATVAGHVVADTFARILIAISFLFLLLLFFCAGARFLAASIKESNSCWPLKKKKKSQSQRQWKTQIKS